MSRITFEAPRGQRIKSRATGVCLYRKSRSPGGLTDLDPTYWWVDGHGWLTDDEIEPLRGTPGYTGCGTHAPCRTVRAFRKMLGKYPRMRGRAVLVGRYIGHSIYG